MIETNPSCTSSFDHHQELWTRKTNMKLEIKTCTIGFRVFYSNIDILVQTVPN